jgi:hypothetical protein
MAQANDAFASATTLTGTSGTLTDEDNTGCTTETNDPLVALGFGTRTLWYKWVAPSTGAIHVNTAPPSGSPAVGDTVLGIFSGTGLGSLTTLWRNDDRDADTYSDVRARVTSGETYYIEVTGYATTNQGKFNLVWDFTSFTDPTTLIYVGDYNWGVQVFDQDGVWRGVFDTSSFDGHYTGMAKRSDGTIYVSDSFRRKLHTFDSSWMHQRTLTPFGLPGGGTLTPGRILFDSSDNYFVTGGTGGANPTYWELMKFNSSDSVQATYTYSHTAPAFGDIGKFGPDGNIWGYQTWAGGTAQFIAINPANGSIVSSGGTYGTGDGQFTIPSGLAWSSADDGFYISDGGPDRLMLFSYPSLAYASKFGSFGSGNTQFKNPQDIGVAASGTIYVADYDNNRVQKLDSSYNYISTICSRGHDLGKVALPGWLYVEDVAAATSMFVPQVWKITVR